MIVALHGFLGLPSDWESISLNLPIQAVDIACHNNFWGWAKTFNANSRILMGYSLGGRLAMHALLEKPGQWDAAIIISANPGLSNPEEKKKRLEKSRLWASRFEHDPWDKLMEQWESQEVFDGNTHRFIRKEKDYQRQQLADMQRYWSVGLQDDLRKSLKQLPLPILWIAGAKDPAYAVIASSMQFDHPKSKVWIAPNAGHRAPWEQPAAFQQQVNAFITNVIEFG